MSAKITHKRANCNSKTIDFRFIKRFEAQHSRRRAPDLNSGSRPGNYSINSV